MTRLKHALSEAAASREREYLDLEQQLAEAERARAAAASRERELAQRLEASASSCADDHGGVHDEQHSSLELQQVRWCNSASTH